MTRMTAIMTTEMTAIQPKKNARRVNLKFMMIEGGMVDAEQLDKVE